MPRALAQQAPELPEVVVEAPTIDVNAPTIKDLELSNVVLTASKTRTTIQEAPAIVSVITADDMRKSGTRTLNDAMARVPGWIDYSAFYHEFDFPVVRGTLQAALILHDGVSAFDPWFNISTVHRILPLELYKRIEVVTGPGGVLWGANSYLGIVNLITKDVEDIHGVEAAAGYGDGPGDHQVFKAYAMAGQKLLGGKLKLVLHASYENYGGPTYRLAQHLYSTSLPQPNSRALYGPQRDSDYPRSQLAQFNGKASYGPLSLYWHLPLGIHKYYPVTLPGATIFDDPPGDPAVDVDPDPNVVRLDCAPGSAPELDAECNDPEGRARRHQLNWFDRYAILELHKLFRNGKLGVNAKGYFYNYNRQFDPIGVLPSNGITRGGVSFAVDGASYRAGTQADLNVELTPRVRLITGGETFYEWVPLLTARFRGPTDLNRLPLFCPLVDPDGAGPLGPQIAGDDPASSTGCPLPFAFGADRVVLAGFLNGQFNLGQLTLDGGARVQASPGGDQLPSGGTGRHRRGYSAQTLFSAAAVYRFLDDYHVKLNYAEGFRPPVFNNTDANNEAIQIGGSPDLEVERSRALQAEVNARVLKNVRYVREMALRLDYSFTKLDNLIQVTNGARYTNSGQRDIHSAELLSKLALRGGHHLEAGYTFMKVLMADKGYFRGGPEHWFHLGAMIDTGRYVDLNMLLRVVGAFEDPDRLVDLTSYNEMQKRPIVVEPSDVVFDRVAPQAQLQLGLRVKQLGVRGLTLKADAYNVLDQRGAQGDYFYDLSPRRGILPNPIDRFRFFATLQYQP